MRAWAAALALLAGSGYCAGLGNFPAPGSAQSSIDLSSYACARNAQALVCRRTESDALRLYTVEVSASVLSLRDGKLMRVSAVFDEARFDEFRDAMRAELGRGEEGAELLKAGMGGTFSNRFEVWREDSQVLLLEQYFERVMSSALTTMSNDEFVRLQAARQLQRVRGARDL